MAAKFELKKSSNGQFFFNLMAANGEVILTSQRYKTKASAENGIESVKSNAASDERFDRRTSGKEQPYFVLTAANGEIIGTSEMYSSPAARDKGIDAVKRAAPDARVEDVSEA